MKRAEYLSGNFVRPETSMNDWINMAYSHMNYGGRYYILSYDMLNRTFAVKTSGDGFTADTYLSTNYSVGMNGNLFTATWSNIPEDEFWERFVRI